MRRHDIERLLPAVYQLALRQSASDAAGAQRGEDAQPLVALLDAMEGLHEDTERRLQTIEQTFDPRRCPPRFVPLLAAWVALRIEVSTGLGRQRELVAGAVALGTRRGTHDHLRALLVRATGLTDITLREGRDAAGKPRPFHVLVSVPSALAPHLSMLHEIIASEKPAHLTYELCVNPGGDQ